MLPLSRRKAKKKFVSLVCSFVSSHPATSGCECGRLRAPGGGGALRALFLVFDAFCLIVILVQTRNKPSLFTIANSPHAFFSNLWTLGKSVKIHESLHSNFRSMVTNRLNLV